LLASNNRLVDWDVETLPKVCSFIGTFIWDFELSKMRKNLNWYGYQTHHSCIQMQSSEAAI